MTFTITLLVLFSVAHARDLCTPTAAFIEIDSFTIEQKIKRDLPLNFGPYSTLMNDMSTNIKPFKEIVQNYTQNESYDLEEPDTLIPYNEQENLILIEAISKNFAIECYKRQAAMVDGIDQSDKAKLLKLMAKHSLTKIPLRLTNFHGVLSTFTGTQIERPTADIQYASKQWPFLLTDGSYEFPSAVVTTEVLDTVIKGFCKKNANPWELGGTSRQSFINLMTKISREFPFLTKNLNSLSKQFTKKLTNDTDKLSLSPPVPLTQLNNLIRKFTSLSNWRQTKPSDLDIFQNIYKLIRNSKKYFSKLSHGVYEIDPAPVMQKLQLNSDVYTGSNQLTIVANKNDDVSTFEIDVTDVADIYILYYIKPFIHKKNIPEAQYLLKSATKTFIFYDKPTLNHCNENEEIKTCHGWIGNPAPTSCIDYLMGKATGAPTTCPLVATKDTISATRTNCQNEDGIVISNSKKKSVIRTYCDNLYKSQIILQTPLKFLTSTCELRELIDDTEITLLPQINNDLLDTDIITDNTNPFELDISTYDDWVMILVYSIPSGLGVIATLCLLICATIFCLNPSKLRDLCSCLKQSNSNTNHLPVATTSSPYQSPVASYNNTPANSRPVSRAASPAPSNKKMDFTHSYHA